MNKIINIGSRKSELAIAQTNIVINKLKKHFSNYEFRIIKITTIGDRILDKPLISFGGKGVFISEFEDALVNDKIDIAVHSAKDMPIDIPKGLKIIAAPEREDPRDVLITLKDNNLNSKDKIIIGTSSLRRQLQISKLIENKVQCKNIRGNINTRLIKLENEEYDGVILAAAGIKRLSIDKSDKYNFKYMECKSFVPAGGQGIIAVEGKENSFISNIISAITDKNTMINLETEREVLRLLNAGCHEPIGVYSYIEQNKIHINAIYKNKEKVKNVKVCGNIFENLLLAEKIAVDLKSD